MLEWFIPLLNIMVICFIFYIGQQNHQVGLGPFEYFNNRFMQARSMFASPDAIYLLWSSGCVHCRNLHEGKAWPMFLTRAANAGIKVKEIQMDSAMSDEDKETVKKAGDIPGVPYIVRLSSGPPDPFMGDRSSDEDLMKWALRV